MSYLRPNRNTLSKTVPLAPWAIQDNGLIPQAKPFSVE